MRTDVATAATLRTRARMARLPCSARAMPSDAKIMAAASGIARFTPVVIETGSYAKTGHASAQDWLGAVSGSSASAAKARLAAAERAASVPILAEALRDGDLSTPQLKVLADASAIAPEAPATLDGIRNDLFKMTNSHEADGYQRLARAASEPRRPHCKAA